MTLIYGIHLDIPSLGKIHTMRYLIGLFTLSLLLLQSSTQDSFEEQLMGVWVQTGYADKIYTFERNHKFIRSKPGIEFKKGGKLLKRQNAGFCGTPPITYANNEGQWASTENGVILDIEYQFWGGKSITQWDVVELTEDVLKVKILAFETEKPSIDN